MANKYPRNSSNGYCFCSSHLGSPILLINNIFQMVAVESRERPLNRGESTGLTRRLSFPKMKRNVFLGGSHLKTPSETCIDSKKIRLCCDEVQDVCESLELKSFNHCPVCRSMWFCSSKSGAFSRWCGGFAWYCQCKSMILGTTILGRYRPSFGVHFPCGASCSERHGSKYRPCFFWGFIEMRTGIDTIKCFWNWMGSTKSPKLNYVYWFALI